MGEIQLSIVERVKKELDINNDIDPFNLYDLLYATRNNCHPDKFQDDKLKSEAEERFKKLSQLLNDLSFHLEQERLTKKASEIVVFKDKYELLQSKQNITSLEKTLTELTKQNQSLKDEIKELQILLDEQEKKDLRDSQNDLIDIYKPKKSNLIAVSVTTLLLLTTNLITNLTSIKEKIVNIMPFGTQYINYILFTTLALLMVDMLLRRKKMLKVKLIADELTSPKVIRDFHDSYKQEEDHYFKTSYFTESDVTDFIEHNYCRRKYLKSLAYYVEGIFIIRDHKSINHLKDIFISNLIAKKLISIGKSKDLDRKFIIK